MTDSVTADDVRHVASLARLGIDEARVLSLARELNTILDHMRVLREVNTDGIEEAVAVGASGMRLRPDQPPPIQLDEPPERFAAEMRAGFFIVPRLATHGDAEAS